MVRVVGARVCDVVHHVLGVESEALGDRLEALGAERALRVDVERLALAAALRDGQLAGDAERVTELRLAGSELAEQLGDGAGLDAACRAEGSE